MVQAYHDYKDDNNDARIVTILPNVDPKFAGFSTDGATDNQVF